MNHRLIYVIGPSGVGKDTILNAIRHELISLPNIQWAKRTITRPKTSKQDESHEGVSDSEFSELSALNAFALQWEANNLRYGIRHEELSALNKNNWIFLNGSRQYLQIIADRYPGLTLVHITAEPSVIKKRLIQRGRESNQMIAERLNRLISPIIPTGVNLIEIQNNSTVEDACHALMAELSKLEDWPKMP